MLRFLIIFLVAISPCLSKAQAIEPKHTFNFELGLPNGFTNKPFKNIMQGLVYVSPYYQYALKNHLIFGAGLNYSYFAINQFKLTTKVRGGVHSGGFFLKAGWEKFHNDRFATDLSVKFGYTQNYYVSDRSDTTETLIYQVNSSYVEPTIGFILTVDEFSSYRLFIGYGFQGYGYRPNMIGLESFEGYDPNDFDKVTSFLVVGFGYTHYFKAKS